MAFYTYVLESLCPDPATLKEANKIYQSARVKTNAGSGFDLGEDRTALAAVCAFIASQTLNNTCVTLQAAQVASCQSMLKFKRLIGQVNQALAERKSARREPLTYRNLAQHRCPQVSKKTIIEWMDKIEVAVLESGECSEEIEDDDITCAVFAWICNLVTVRLSLGQRLFDSKAFEEEYQIKAASMREITVVIKGCCKHLETHICEDYKQQPVSPTKSLSMSPRKSPTKRTPRALPSKDSPQKRKVAVPDPEDDDPIALSPTKRLKVGPQATASSSIVTLETIKQFNARTRSQTASPTKPPPPAPSRRANPSSQRAPAPPRQEIELDPMDVDDARSSLDEENFVPPPRRRFRPVFNDQKQWVMCDPRLAKLALAAEKHKQGMIGLCGVPFAQYRRLDQDVAMDSD
ncbi:hypothetical protein B0H10DRAFT_2098247 [Mycena sp. CBHHK59/15]|nr:hypothetical protein B0H10DRAFT_2098247 [Mycena sp. CBHHK59/15]